MQLNWIWAISFGCWLWGFGREGGQYRGTHKDEGTWGEIWMNGSVHKHAEHLVPYWGLLVTIGVFHWLNILPV